MSTHVEVGAYRAWFLESRGLMLNEKLCEWRVMLPPGYDSYRTRREAREQASKWTRRGFCEFRPVQLLMRAERLGKGTGLTSRGNCGK